MKAMVWTKYGPPGVFKLREVDRPVPKANQVLIKVHAATVTMGDCEVRSLNVPLILWIPLRLVLGIWKPRVLTLGQEIAGEVEAVGQSVTRLKKGDLVFSATTIRFGGYAEYICLPASSPRVKPANLSFNEAATVPTGGINGQHFVRKARIRPGENVLIVGAGGSIGSYALQIAKSFGARVTCVDSAEKLEMLRSNGADHVIDFAQEDFSKSGVAYDVIIDTVGKSPFAGSLRSLNPNGRYVLGNPAISAMIRGLWVSMTTNKKVIFEFAEYGEEDYAFLEELIAAGKIKPVIDRCYPLEQLPDAHRYVEEGHKKGNVVITVA